MNHLVNQSDSYDFLFKIILIGDSGVGKSAVLNRYSRNMFCGETKTTIGVEFATSFMNVDDKNIKVTIWDTAGQDRFRAATRAYYRNTLGAFIVYDITKRSTFDNVKKWLQELKENVENDLVITLVGNKCDLRHIRAVSTQEALKLAAKNNMGFMETSALDSINVGNVFKELITDIYTSISNEKVEENDITIEESMTTINVTLKADTEDKMSCCNTN